MNLLHSRCSELKTCGFALLLLVLFCNTGFTAQPLEQNQSADPVADISLLLDQANHALDADPLTAPFRKNALLYIDQVLTLDPGNLHAYILLYAVVTHYSKIVELLLETTDSVNFAIQLAEAEKFRDQTEKVITAYQLDQDIVLRMNRVISQTRTQCQRNRVAAKTAKIPPGKCYQEALGEIPHTPAVQPKLEKQVLAIQSNVETTEHVPAVAAAPPQAVQQQPQEQYKQVGKTQQSKFTAKWNNRQRVIGRF